jgi:hypothetical protein
MNRDAAPPGLERWIWRRLGPIWTLASLLPWGAVALRHWAASAGFWPASAAHLGLWTYTSAGWTVLMSVLALTVGVGCVVVRVMKGPPYTADSYPPAPRHNPLKQAADEPPGP